jgi:hypothetical protein
VRGRFDSIEGANQIRLGASRRFFHCVLLLAVVLPACAVANLPFGDGVTAGARQESEYPLAQSTPVSPTVDPLDAIVRGMSVREKVGQLFLLGFSGSDAAGAAPALQDLRAGGIVFVANAASANTARTITEGIRHVYSDQLLMFLLRARKPEVYRDRRDIHFSGGEDYIPIGRAARCDRWRY